MSAYVSWQYGQKAGIAQFVNGISSLTVGEQNSAYEGGLKSVLGNKLLVNTDVFLTDIHNYQQSVQAYDAYTTTLSNDGTLHYTSVTGNVPRVRVKGIEVDGVYAGLRNTSIRFAGSYNEPLYKRFPNSGQPVENGFTGAPPYRDVSGQRLPGAALWTFNIAPDYRIPVSEDHEIHLTLNTAFTCGSPKPYPGSKQLILRSARAGECSPGPTVPPKLLTFVLDGKSRCQSRKG